MSSFQVNLDINQLIHLLEAYRGHQEWGTWKEDAAALRAQGLLDVKGAPTEAGGILVRAILSGVKALPLPA